MFDHPEVRLINLPRRLRTVGEKMNLAVALASHDLLFVWDDDIYLPHRLAVSVARFDPAKGFFRPGQAWLWDEGVVRGPTKNSFHAGSCYARTLFDAVRGYPADGTGYDLIFEQRIARTAPGSAKPSAITPHDISYIYRWSGAGSYHLSGYGAYQPAANVGHREVEDFVQYSVASGQMQRGRIQLAPHWRQDYQQLVSELIQSEPAR